MSLQYNPTLLNVMNAFQNQGLASNSFYSREQFFTALDKMCGMLYDRTVGEQLFEQCQVNFKQQCALEDFCQVIIEADRILKLKISQTELQIKQYTADYENYDKDLQEAKMNQSMNPYGIDRDSILSLILHQAQNINTQEDFLSSFVTFSVASYQHTSDLPQESDKQNPIFKQQFQFNIKNGKESVSVSLFVTKRTQQPVLIGSGFIKLDELRDQSVHDIKLQLLDSRGLSTGTVLIMDAQWIYNKLKYVQGLLQKYEETINLLQADIEDFKRDLAIIQQPFTGIKPQYANSISQNIIGASLFSPNQNPNSSLKPAIFIQGENGQFSKELRQGLILMIIFGLVSLIISFTRTDFLDFLLFLLLIIIVILDHLNPEYIVIVGGFNVFTILYDIIWFHFYDNEWSTLEDIDPAMYSSGIFLARIILILVILNIIIKIALCYFLFHFHNQSKIQNETMQIKFWKFEFQIGVNRHNLFSQDKKLHYGEI